MIGATKAERDALLARARSIAIVGISPDPGRASHRVAAYLTRTGYELWGVNPHVDEVLGIPCVPTLADLPSPPDIVDVFRRREHLAGVVAAAIEVGSRAVWFQSGLVDEDAASAALEAGLVVVQDECLKVEHARLAAAGGRPPGGV